MMISPRLACILFSIGLLLAAFHVTAGKKFDFNSRCQQAYASIMELRLNEGTRLLLEERRADPDNLVPVLLENYIDFFVLFLNEDPAAYKLHHPDYQRRLELLDAGPKNSPYYLYCKSVIHFQWAAIQVKFGQSWDAGWSFRRAYLQASENLVLFPKFSPSQVILGAMQVASGTIPEGYRWLSNLLGIKGSVKEGMSRLSYFINRKDIFSGIFLDEAIFYYLYLKFYVENDRDGVFEFINNHNLDLVNNHVFAYLACNLSINSQQAARGIKIINGRNPSAEYLQTPVWKLELGYASLQHLEPHAGRYLEEFLSEFRGKFYVKDAWQKLSWHYYIAGDMEKANSARTRLLRSGTSESEADKQAQHEAESGKWPNRVLLKARLLNDGGYHQEALAVLQGMSINDFSDISEKLEFSYRAGRIYDDMHNDSLALIYYAQAVKMGESRQEYYASRAALQTGFVFEKRGDCRQAAAWFRRCIQMKPSEYKNSLDQRAKSGLARCEPGK
ncbi:MAG TPA: hypothetical protein VLC28_04540 [Flavitalea sp.]|nr:hypothetical protein [Flavitalea sp.]